MNIAKSGKGEVAFMHRFVDKQIDLRWIEAIEQCIIPLDTIIRNPRRFISQEEEIIPIELARKITTDSIKHLAQHTNMIAKVEGDNVTPNRILNIYKEESYETYENRFIYTLLFNIQYFIDKRLNEMKSGTTGEDVSSLYFKDEFENGQERIRYTLEMSTQTKGYKQETHVDLHADTSKMSRFERVERIRKILFDFQNSPVMKALSGCALVRPPIMRTNVIAKNPDFKKAKELWDFIETYREAGFQVEVTEYNEMPSNEYLDDIYGIMALHYALMKHHTGAEANENYVGQKRVITPKLAQRIFREILEDITLDIDEIKHIFTDEVTRVSRQRAAAEKKILAMIDRAIAAEDQHKKEIDAQIKRQEEEERRAARAKLAEERARRKAEEAALKEQRAAERKARAEEKARLQKEAEMEKARLKREKEREKARKEKELALEKARKQREKEKEKARKEKALALEKEKARKQREKEREQAKKEKERQLEQARKEQEKLRLQAEREKRLALLAEEKEKARVKREKELEKARKEKALALEKEKARKQREKDLEKARKEKALALEKEKARKQREKELEKARKEKALALEKEKARKQKEREKAKAEKEKAKQQAK